MELSLLIRVKNSFARKNGVHAIIDILHLFINAYIVHIVLLN